MLPPASSRTGEAVHDGTAARVPASVQLVSNESAFRELRPAWNELAAQRPDLSVFACHEWFDAAWQWRRESSRLFVLVWLDNGQVNAILPMQMETRGRPPWRVRELSFLTVPDTQVCDILVADVDRARAVEALASNIAARAAEWDVMRLEYVRSESTAATSFASSLAALGFRVAQTSSPGNPFISLEGDWSKYYEARSRRLKKAGNLAANRLRKAGDVRIDWLAPGTHDPGRTMSFLEGAIDVSRNSWKAGTGTTLDRPAPGAFVQRLSALAAERGMLSVWMLSLDGKPLATEYQLVQDGNVHALRSDFRQGYEEMSPGSHLNQILLEQLFGKGYRRYYMGPGNNAYKYRWSEGAEPMTSVTIYGRSISGRLSSVWETEIKPKMASLRARFMTWRAPMSDTNFD